MDVVERGPLPNTVTVLERSHNIKEDKILSPIHSTSGHSNTNLLKSKPTILIQTSNMLLITSGDYYSGQSLALQLLEQPEFKGKIRVSCRDTSRCENLRRLGAELVQTDYKNEQQLQKAVQGIQYVVLVVEPENDRVLGAENIVRAATQAQVRNIILISQNGAEDGEQKSFQEFREIEEKFQQQLKNSKWVILRTDFFQQNFLLWADYVQEKRQFPLTISEQDKFTPLNINDLARVLIALVAQGKNALQPTLNDQYNNQTYTLTGPEAIDGDRIIEELKRSTGISDCKFQQLKRQELERYLKELTNSQPYQERLREQEVQVTLQKLDNQNRRLKIPGNLTAIQIETYLDIFDWIKSGKGYRVSQDVKRLTGEDAQRVGQFFKEHAQDFKRNA
ncbi:hypothetical protein BC937DRAFT_92155 [Endogone sp. FLAS-F59071]|nr:hypothetical protein BC937DRAFT_92155 [Endogone sp. FLAS-F59071]|eukprot:RUS15671.1 hypothetical protein BC937DRAFT_92155 [Endogone sp. FLAS-F59071]